MTEEGITDPDLDPDLQMLHDEHLKQTRDLRNKYDEAKRQLDELNKEKQEWQQMAETTKADNDKIRASAGGEADADVADASKMGLAGTEPDGPTQLQDEPVQGKTISGEGGGPSEAEVQNLAQIRQDMDDALAKNRNAQGLKDDVSDDASDLSGSTAAGQSSGGKPGAPDGKDQPGGPMAQKQIAFLESTLDSVTKNNRALAAENRTLKFQRLPVLQTTLKKLQARCKELEQQLQEAKQKR